MAKKSTVRTCVFCGSNKDIEGEHVWPDWLNRRVFTERTLAPVRRGRFAEDGSLEEHAQWSAFPAEEQVDCVCHTCNHGWMSDLETAAAATLAALMNGEGVCVREHARQLLAFWALVRVLIIEFKVASSERAVPPTIYEYVYQHRYARKVPPNTHLALMHYAGAEDDNTVGYRQQSLFFAAENGSRPAHPNAYATTFYIKRLVCEVFGHVTPYRLRLRPGSFADHRLVLWPPPGDPIVWPPVKSLSSPGDMLTILRPNSGQIVPLGR